MSHVSGTRSDRCRQHRPVRPFCPGDFHVPQPNNQRTCIQNPKTCLHHYLYQRFCWHELTGQGELLSVSVCLCCQVISQTLSPTWNQSLLMAHVLLNGDLQYIQEEPPRMVIELYDDDALVSKVLNNQILWHWIFGVNTCQPDVCFRVRQSIWDPQLQSRWSACPLTHTHLQLCSTALCTVAANQEGTCLLPLNCWRSNTFIFVITRQHVEGRTYTCPCRSQILDSHSCLH